MAREGEALPSDNDAPSRIGKYAISGRIGRGAMGHVFRAHDSVLNREVAIKMMTADVSADPDLSQRFLREAQSAARLNHPNIVTLHDFGEDNGQFFMAMELLEGHDLAALIKQKRLASLDDKLALMDQVCDGLAYAHSMDIVHRDLKPANIHIQHNGRVKIMDFGLARMGGSSMTRAGTVMGSPNYMSPEQVRGERADARSDVFALGAVFYELLSGRRAFDAEAMHAILYKVANVEPDPLSLLCPDLPTVVIEVVEKALQKDPAQRFADAREMREALDVCERVLDGAVDEESALASLREARTIVEPGPLPQTDGAEDDVPTLSATSPTRTGVGRRSRSGSVSVKVGRPGSDSGSRTVPRAGSGSAPDARTKQPTGPRPQAPPPPVARASRAPLYVAGVLGVTAIAVALFFGLRAQAPAPPAADDGKAAALVAVAVEAQLDVARKSLEFKDLEGAIDAAQKALRLDPKNAEARSIRDRARATLDAVEADVREAREAAQKGDIEKASQAVARVLAKVPNHPVASELSAQLNSRFRTRAEEALGQMKRAADAAERASATTTREYRDGSRLAREAAELLGRRQYTEATQKALGAQAAYDRARAVALELAAKPKPSAPPPSAPAPTPAAATPPPVVPSAPPSSPAVVHPAPATPLPAPAPAPEALVRRVIAEFARAIETKDVALYKSLRPGLSKDEEGKLRAAFESVQSQEVELSIQSISVEGNRAVVRAQRSGRVNGQAVPSVGQVFHLVKRPSGWVIDSIGQ